LNFPDRIRIEREPPAAPVQVLRQSTACRFSFLEAVKNEQLMGTQTAQASIMLPLSVEVIEHGEDMDQYRFYLLSPTSVGNLVEVMVPHTEKWAKTFRYFIAQVFQHGQSPTAP
jgi:hypothetical protein